VAGFVGGVGVGDVSESVMSRINLVQVPGGHFSSLQGENLLAVSDQIRACLEADGA
jgi:hypothetical protein